MTLKELILAAFFLTVLVGAQIIVTRATSLLRQTAWLDEVHTAMIVSEPDSAKFKASLSNECVDANFPVYHALLRWSHLNTPARIRVVSLASTVFALIAIYALLRGSFTPVESAVGVLTVWATPLILYHAFQARFYAPWFSAVVCFAAAVRWERSTSHRALAAIAIALTAIMACTLHMMGIAAIGLVVLVEFILDQRPMKTRLLSLLPVIAGPIAMLCFAPMMIAQHSSYQIKGWLVGNPIRLFYSTLVGVVPAVGAVAIVLGLWATYLLCSRRSSSVEPDRPISLKPVLGLSALLLFPIILLAISLIDRPVLLPRYAIVSVAAIAPAAAFAASRMKRSVAVIVCIVLLCEGGADLTRRVREAAGYTNEINTYISTVRAEPNLPALFESRHQLFPVVFAAPDLSPQCAYVDFEPGHGQLDPVVEVFERDVARKFQRVFGKPRVMEWGKVIALDRFLLVSMDENRERIALRFSTFKVRQVGKQTFELSR